MEKEILFLKKLVEDSTTRLQPVSDLNSVSGYTYPLVKAFFGIHDGTDRKMLEDLARKGCLERKFFDKIHLCPNCTHYNLNIREVCPECKSGNVSIVEMLHHIKCAYVAPETEFRKGVSYSCPKCCQQLRHSGIDYERWRQSHLCQECKHIFTEPLVDCYCLFCSHHFGIEKTISQNIYSYHLADEGVSAVRKGHFRTPEPEHAFFNADAGLYTFTFFQQHLFKEIERAKRFNRPLSIAVINIEDHDRAAGLFKEMATAVRENVRAMDIVAHYDKTRVIVIFPELNRENIRRPVERITAGVERLDLEEKKLKVKFNVITFPEDGKTAEDLITRIKAIL